jgi:hypothetical protein
MKKIRNILKGASYSKHTLKTSVLRKKISYKKNKVARAMSSKLQESP